MWQLTLLALVGLAQAQFTPHEVTTKHGTVIGQSMDVHGLTTGVRRVSSFWDLPYAEAPVGDLRFAKPVEIGDWEQPFYADTPGTQCPQGGGIFDWTHPGYDDIGEDCLHLNVFTPTDAADQQRSLPVMVWFHGGAYSSSGNVQYPGYTLAMRDVVVVVANYRLGILGFFSADHDDYRGNWGLWDQGQALNWVKENIREFGGDPNQVTIFGQSAGASSTGLHLISPETANLFNQAICESGSELTFWAVNGPESHPETYGEQVAESFGCLIVDGNGDTDVDAMVDCLRQVDSADIVDVGITCTPGYYCLGFAPVIDGEFIPDYPGNIRKDGNHHQGPLIQGQCTDDGSPYSLSLIPEAGLGGFTHDQWLWHLYCDLISIYEPLLDEQEVEDTFEAFAWYYAPWPHIEDKEMNRESFNVLVTDAGFGVAGDQQLKYHSEQQPQTWHYLLGYRSDNAAPLIPEWMGVPHQGDLPYVWGYPYLTIEENQHLRNDCLLTFDIIAWDDRDNEYTDFISALWTNFAKSGDPNTPGAVPMPFGQEPVEWLPFDTVDYNYYLMDRDEVKNMTEYRQRNFAFYTPYLEYITGFDILTGTKPDEETVKNRYPNMARRPGPTRALPDCSTYPEG